MKFIFSYMKKYKWWIALGMTLKLAGTIGELSLPYVLEHMIDDIVPMQSISMILIWGLIMIVLAFLTRTLNVIANKNACRVAKDCAHTVRQDLFWKSINLSGDQVDQFGLPSLTSRMTSDSYNVQDFIQSIQSLGVRAPIMLIGGICITMTMDVGLSSILCIMAPIMLVIICFVSWKGIPLYNRVQDSLDDIVRTMRENITGIRVVKALSKEEYEKSRFGANNEEMTRREIKASIIMSLPGPIMTMALNCGLTLVVIVGAIRVNAGVTQPGVILAFLTYFNMILMGIMALNRVFMLLSKANASAKRIEAVVKMEDDLKPIPKEEAKTTDREGYIVFDHVTFSYNKSQAELDSLNGKLPESTLSTAAANRGSKDSAFDGEGRQNCLTDIDFVMKKGGSLGIIGATGCGKTTIINLLMRFYDTQQGGIFIDGKDVRTFDKDELHRKFGVVFQNDVIFADTIRENISFGRKVDDQGLQAAAEDARAAEFIEGYEDTYDHKANIHGANFSGGQRQRILISRALAAKPEILILDDSSSALDYKTDAALRKAIREHHSDATTIIIAQRISSIMSLDDIIMLDEGKVIGHGTHEQLLESCPMYKEIFKTQMGGVS